MEQGEAMPGEGEFCNIKLWDSEGVCAQCKELTSCNTLGWSALPSVVVAAARV